MHTLYLFSFWKYTNRSDVCARNSLVFISITAFEWIRTKPVSSPLPSAIRSISFATILILPLGQTKLNHHFQHTLRQRHHESLFTTTHVITCWCWYVNRTIEFPVHWSPIYWLSLNQDWEKYGHHYRAFIILTIYSFKCNLPKMLQTYYNQDILLLPLHFTYTIDNLQIGVPSGTTNPESFTSINLTQVSN